MRYTKKDFFKRLHFFKNKTPLQTKTQIQNKNTNPTQRKREKGKKKIKKIKIKHAFIYKIPIKRSKMSNYTQGAAPHVTAKKTDTHKTDIRENGIVHLSDWKMDLISGVGWGSGGGTEAFRGALKLMVVFNFFTIFGSYL